MDMKRQLTLGLLAILALSCFIVLSTKPAHGYSDWAPGGGQRLWTTNATGLEEINQFNIGDPIYFKTSGTNYPIEPGNYTLYLFEGNVGTPPMNGMNIPSDFGIPLVAMNISTNDMGQFGQTPPGPLLIWNSATTNNFTIILDQICYLLSGKYYPSTNYGKWDDSTDYRDDLCTAIPTPPSFFVVPQVAFGTVTATLGFFCGLGLFLKMKKNRNPT
jgi:hypothetical protein